MTEELAERCPTCSSTIRSIRRPIGRGPRFDEDTEYEVCADPWHDTPAPADPPTEGVGTKGEAVIATVDGEVTVAFDPEDTRVVEASREFIENVVANWNELSEARAALATAQARVAHLEEVAERRKRKAKQATRKANLADKNTQRVVEQRDTAQARIEELEADVEFLRGDLDQADVRLMASVDAAGSHAARVAELEAALREIATETWNPAIGLPGKPIDELHVIARRTLEGDSP